jgi:hypothetical protein
MVKIFLAAPEPRRKLKLDKFQEDAAPSRREWPQSAPAIVRLPIPDIKLQSGFVGA